jgi:hypothetical protein
MMNRIKWYLGYFWWWIFAPVEDRRWARIYLSIVKALQPNIKGGNMEADMANSPIIKEKVKDQLYAVNLYRIMCNNEFTCAKKKEPWSCTWRSAGAIVAELRDIGEDYMDFYCSGNESMVDEEVEQDLKNLGWTVVNG